MAEPEEEDPNGVPEWVVTYGDMMSLLLTFFIMLVSLSELKSDEGSVRAMLDAVREAFGPTSGGFGSPGKSLQTSSAYSQRNSRGQRSDGGMEKASRASSGPSGPHSLAKRISHGTSVTLGGPALFPRFEASLTKELRESLDIIAGILGPKPNRIMVRGHASPEPLPPNLPYRDQLDLSFERARAVAEYLTQKNIDPNRILVSAAGDTEPRTKTRQKEAQKLNRRVDVFLLDSYTTHPPTAQATGR